MHYSQKRNTSDISLPSLVLASFVLILVPLHAVELKRPFLVHNAVLCRRAKVRNRDCDYDKNDVHIKFVTSLLCLSMSSSFSLVESRTSFSFAAFVFFKSDKTFCICGINSVS